jgi:hypothetical protein
MVSKSDYSDKLVEAARSVLLEIMTVLGEYREGIAVIGGWVPELLFHAKEKHIGSIDVDLALDHSILSEIGYETICRHLEKSGYMRDEKQPFIFYRTFSSHGEEVTIQVDLLAGEYKGTGKKHRTQKIQDINARKARGCDLVFSIYDKLKISGSRPDGKKDSTEIKIAGIVPFIVMKGMAIYDRNKEKDCYDVYFCVKNYPGGIKALVGKFAPHLKNKLIREGLNKISEKFASVDHVGPANIADFLEITDPEERSITIRDSYERVSEFLRKLKIHR